MNIFDALPSNFFIIMTSVNKELYYDCLKIIYDIYDSRMGFDITREEVIDAILEYLEENDQKVVKSEDGGSITQKERANYILQKFEDCGWISVETSNDYVDLINFKVHALTIMEALLKICNEDWSDSDNLCQPVFEYRGYLFSIYSLLNNPNVKEHGLMLKQVYHLATEFVNEIKKINLKLKSYIEKIARQKEIKDLMELLVDYKTQLVDKSYQRLKTYDNVDRYKQRIIDSLDNLLNDEILLGNIREEYMTSYDIGYQEATYNAVHDIDQIIEIFSGLDELINDIELKNKIYVNSTITKVKFLLNNETDVLGKLNYIMKYIKDFQKSDDKLSKELSPLFSLCKQESISTDSLYSPKVNYKTFTPVKLTDPEVIDIEDLQNKFIQEFDLEFSEDKVIAFVVERLKYQKSFKASELFINKPTEENLIRLLYILVYASTCEDYQINKLEHNYENDDFIINDFEIARK